MRTYKLLTIIFCLGFVGISYSQDKSSMASDKKVLAEKIVNQCAAIKDGEMVLLTGGVSNIDFLEELTINVAKTGAYPLLTVGSDRLTRRYFTEVPEKFDSRTPEIDLKLFDFITTIISVDYGENPGLLADIPPARFATRGKAMEPLNELMMKKNIKSVNLGNGLYPSEAKAKQYGMSKEELDKVFWQAVNTDYTKLEASGKAVKAALSDGKVVKITNPNGTNLTLKVEKRQVFVSDGIISPEDQKLGYAGSQVFLPAGEVYFAPVAGSAEGKIVVDRLLYQDKEINGLVLEFKGGKLVSMNAKSGLEPLKAYYDASGPGKEEFAFVDFGINNDIQITPGSKMVAWMPAGMVTVGIGNNVWAGGENNNPLSLPCFLPGSTVSVDNKVLVENGKLLVTDLSKK